ncbi:substrate-specific component NikM of nickel ECF transporter [Aquitalea magnusonii]|uniref:Substrate-specific component NikM of nickel ECF transporter n=1 Tax=Aquitalea magnusonii TaxID=332411 RepID=A0A3G9GKH5_9NEIS|nr:cobalt transporter CbiM [Aquitalea magnusonii]BBF86552.1 substrate-specific component NikM of nickel ECF transporter [Aquitalea magnusonii]
MHIPDGYLSPSTCALAYAVALPFWLLAYRRAKALLHTRLVPLFAVFSAFCFVIMMFNLPLPGGTSGHAVGMTIVSIVLGPWASIIAVSLALLIQALFFGDGGISSFGANSLNMAVVGSLVAWSSYRLLAAGADISARRRVVAAGLAGYLAINAAALLTAIEFGVQPMLFHDASGTPLYAPYPLSVAIPAMMIGHLSFAGLAEMLLSAGLVAYLQRSHPSLLAGEATMSAAAGSRRSARQLWYGLAGLMILSPLGLLAAGTAWGEWAAEDFANPASRLEIIQASGQHVLPQAAPEGLARLAGLWSAPFPDYAPAFIHSAGFGYVLSAVFGAGLILLSLLLLSQLAGKRGLPQ